MITYSIVDLVAVMAVAGLIGGSLSHFLSLSDGKSHNWTDLGISVLLGIVASVLIPLFLNTISSTLVTDLMSGKDGSPGDMLIFIGFCLLAAISSRKFISSLSEKVLREVSEANKAAREASEAVDNTIVEPESDTDQDRPSMDAISALSQDERSVLKAMQHSRYPLRSAAGLATDVQKPKAVTYDALSSLRHKGYVAQIIRTRGDRWALTKPGQEAQVAEQSNNAKDKT
jgi:hypothetical protein